MLRTHPQSVLAQAQQPPQGAALQPRSFVTSDRSVPTQSGLAGRSRARRSGGGPLLPGGSSQMRTDAPPADTDVHTDLTNDHNHDDYHYDDQHHHDDQHDGDD